MPKTRVPYAKKASISAAKKPSFRQRQKNNSKTQFKVRDPFTGYRK